MKCLQATFRAGVVVACASLALSSCASDRRGDIGAAAPVAQEKAWAIPSDEEIRALLAERMKHNGVGAVVAVIEPQGRRIVSYGRSGASDGRPLDGNTVFQIGSVSKVFVGLVLSDMSLRGEVKLDDPAAKYLPAGVRMPERGRPITLADLSTHMSGLPSMPTNLDPHGEPDPIEAYSVQQLYEFLGTYQPDREPGAKPYYSNLGVSLLGRLLALHAGVEYEELVNARVLRPLGMNSTSINLSADQLRRLAPGHDMDLQPVHSAEMKTLSPSGSLRSTANDLLNFLAANLGYQDTPLKQAMMYQRAAIRAPTSTAPKKNGWNEQALGWRVRKVGGREIFGHEGGKQGYRCSVVIDPERRVGVIVLANARTDDTPGALALHLLIGEPLQPPPPPMPVKQFVKIDRELLDSYAGTYQLEPGTNLILVRKDDRLIGVRPGYGVLEFFAEGPRDFGQRASTDQLTVVVDPQGRVTGLIRYPDGKSADERQTWQRIEGGK